jgi:hypothetical protein
MGIENDFHARSKFNIAATSPFPGLGIELPPAESILYERGLLGDLFNTTKTVVESATASGIGGELIDGAKALAPALADLARRDEDDLETTLHRIISSLSQHISSDLPSQRDVSERGLLEDAFNSTENAVDNKIGSGVVSKIFDGVKDLGPDVIKLVHRDESSSRFSRRGAASSPSPRETLSDVEGLVKEKLHTLLNSLEQHLPSSTSQSHTAAARSLFQAADDVLKSFGTSTKGLVGSAATGAANKVGSGIISEGESVFHHFFNRTAIMESVSTQGEPLPEPLK